MNKEEIEKSPYCEICGHCGDIGCCGISNFIDKHIKGKTNCKNEEIVISELEDLCNYQTETFKDNEKLQSQLDIANKKLDKIEKYIKENACYDEKTKECKCSFSSMALDKILEIIGGEEVSNE